MSTAPQPLSAALVGALIADPAALDQLAAALAPRLALVADPMPAAAGLTTVQAAQRAGLHERTIRRALAARTLTGRTVATRWRVDAADLDAWLALGAPTSAAATPTNGRARVSATAGADAIRGVAA